MALFPGKSCFPLSPDQYVKKKPNLKFPISNSDQLNIIMDVLGAPNEEDISFITDVTALNYIKEFNPQSKGINLKERFPYASEDAIDLLRKMISFNPFFRPSIDECLAHPFLKNVKKTNLDLDNVIKVEIELDKLDSDPSIQFLK